MRPEIGLLVDVMQHLAPKRRNDHQIEKALDSSIGQDFIYTISVQGHGKYPSFYYYCEQIGEMDLFISQLITMLNQRKEPAVLVLYGDHLPGF